MKMFGRGVACLVAGLLSLTGRAETWTTTRGETIEGKLTAVYGPLAWIASKQSGRFVSIADLDDTALGRIVDHLAAQPAPPVWSESAGKVGKALRGRLQVLSGENLVPFDPGTRGEPEFYLAYFGAHWCGPCKRFSPRLVEAYARLKQRAGDRFEVIYVSSDRDAREMLTYVREAKMPWPAIKYSAVGSVAPIERWAGNGIPCLVVLSREGELLFHSYRGKEYLGPDDPLRKFEGLLHLSDPRNRESRRALHRLAMAQHRRAAQDGDRPAKPYLIDLDLARYRTLEADKLMVALEIDENGKVLSATTTPTLSTALKFQFDQDVGEWLFLPAIREGVAQRAAANLPLELQNAGK